MDLEHISHADKLWVALRLVPKSALVLFAVDCAMPAAAATVAFYAAAAAERQRQIESLIWLIQDHKG